METKEERADRKIRLVRALAEEDRRHLAEMERIGRL